MTPTKVNEQDKPNVTDKVKNEELDKKDETLVCINEKRIEICAWILLTIGLCIIITTFYLAIQQKPDQEVDDEWNRDYDNNLSISVVGRVFDKTVQIGGSVARVVSNDSLSGCNEILCHITCSQVENVYSSLYGAMESSSCPSIDVLLLDKQEFPYGVLKNLWITSNLSIHEVIVRSSNIRKIKNNAFNSPIYKNTILMSWSNSNIEKVESGVLLGLYKLKYFAIESRVTTLEKAFFQPIQSTLTHLKLNANLRLIGNENFFAYMHKLEHLDLSYNQFSGALSRNMFKSTPNLKRLIIVDSQLKHIDEDAFEHLKDKLILINLSKNHLKHLPAAVIRPILMIHKTAMINLSENDWNCNCELQELANLYRNYRTQFMDAVLCKASHDLYGKSIDEVEFYNCEVASSAAQETVEEKEFDSMMSTPVTTTSKNYDNKPQDLANDFNIVGSGEVTSLQSPNTFKMRCFHSDSSSSSKSLATGINENNLAATSDLDFLQFPVPQHEFELQLIPENNTVIVTVKKASALMIIWFSEQTADEMTFNTAPFDYTCMSYQAPSLTVGPLVENTTYTFCLIPSMAHKITPFNCLPLHVPVKSQENVWISEDNKQFTIGMLCLIFLVSIIAGALIAYFGIKAYPDLLEGSKNVLVVKKPDQDCYVSTISETEYQKQSSLKKKKPSTMEPPLKKQTSIKLSLPVPPASETPSPPFRMSVKGLERLSSTKSSSTCFEDTFPAYSFQDDDYETPKVCSNEYTIEQCSVSNKYGMSPASPPPLPKRNSNISDSPTMVLNRFSSKFE